MFYFPEGDYVLHDVSDNYKNTNPDYKNNAFKDENGNNASSPILIHGGNFVIKGDGRGRTRLIMDSPNLPSDEDKMYSSPDMIHIKEKRFLGIIHQVSM